MKQILNFRCLPLGMMAVLGLVTVPVEAALPYLPLIGPPPIRIMTYRSDTASVVKFYTGAPVSSTNSLTSSTNKVAVDDHLMDSMGTLGALNGSTAAGGPTMQATPPYTDTTMGAGGPGGVFAMPTPDLVAISPQALANYFRPVQVGTNAAVFVNVSPVSFIPPEPIDKSSHAEYIVK